MAFSPALAVAEREPSWRVFRESVDKTPPRVADAMLKLASVGANDVVYDLGSGDGVIVVAAAKKYGARGLGVDINPKMVARARARAERGGVADKATFTEGDFYKADLRPATVITLFLWPTINMRLRPRLLDLTPGTRIVSHEHDMGAWRPDRVKQVYQKRWGLRPVLLWIVPARIAGAWRMRVDGDELGLNIRQSFQRFRGSASAGGRTHRVRNGRIEGFRVRFDLATASGAWKRYTGLVTPDGGLEGRAWRARRAM